MAIINASAKPPKIYRIAELTRLIKTVLEDEVGEIWVEGELSNFRQPASGHWYFTLKDENAQLALVMFRGNQRGVRFQPKDGMLLRANGLISVYEKSGQYQMIVRALEAAGQGALQAAFEALKRKLEAEGLFDPARKKPLPLLPRHIGIVTSPTGAAIRDILNILTRRFYNLHVVVAPVRVQGPGAAEEITAALNDFNRRGDMDVLIVGRGGGSLEDLWCFNEEVVARAIARSAIPVISAVGHEIDFTISDFVADLRAPTPSAAAELVIGRKADFEGQLQECSRRLGRGLRQQMVDLKHRFQAASRSYVFREPLHLVRRILERIERLRAHIQRQAENSLRQEQQRVDELNGRLTRPMQAWSHIQAMALARLETQLKGINPLAVLERGYSITFRPDGRVIKAANQAQPGDRITTRVAKGTFESEVLNHGDTENRRRTTDNG
ncbi:MAG: exodeoxyribonuclease VII large subunit [Kiritimatiellota bacterium]|nr:exodeoxyribonuclease VII large subunit [Kiritimatiellota bacterium]